MSLSEVFEGPVAGWASATRNWDDIVTGDAEPVAMRCYFQDDIFHATRNSFHSAVFRLDNEPEQGFSTGSVRASTAVRPDRGIINIHTFTPALAAMMALTAASAPTANAADGAATRHNGTALRYYISQRNDCWGVGSNYTGNYCADVKDALAVEASSFREAIQDLKWQPLEMTFDDEVTFEWADNGYHAIASLEGNGTIAYAMLVDGKFVAGATTDASVSTLPEDLRQYLQMA